MSYNKGTKKNPYTTDELQQVDVNAWHGGWVIIDSDTLCFFDIEFNMIPSILGSRTRPFPENLYSQMMEWGMWAGGYTYSHNDLVYITTSGAISYENEHPLGHLDNPYPYEAFEEMVENGFWHGGYVILYDTIKYIRNFSHTSNSSGNTNQGCGCGCGCGSGCGSNSGSSSGSNSSGSNTQQGEDTYNPVSAGRQVIGTVQSGKIKLTLSWTSGIPKGNPESVPFVIIQVLSTKISEVENLIVTEWKDQHTISVSGCFYYKESTGGGQYDLYTVNLGDNEFGIL